MTTCTSEYIGEKCGWTDTQTTRHTQQVRMATQDAKETRHSVMTCGGLVYPNPGYEVKGFARYPMEEINKMTQERVEILATNYVPLLNATRKMREAIYEIQTMRHTFYEGGDDMIGHDLRKAYNASNDSYVMLVAMCRTLRHVLGDELRGLEEQHDGRMEEHVFNMMFINGSYESVALKAASRYGDDKPAAKSDDSE